MYDAIMAETIGVAGHGGDQIEAYYARPLGPGPFGGVVRSVAFTPDGRYLATANANGMVYLLQVPTGP